MRKFFLYIGLFLFSIFFVVFLLSNREPVILNFDPTSAETPFYGSQIVVPLWLAMVMPLIVGYLLGAMGMWMSSAGTRRKASERKAEINQLKKQARAQMQEPATLVEERPALPPTTNKAA